MTLVAIPMTKAVLLCVIMLVCERVRVIGLLEGDIRVEGGNLLENRGAGAIFLRQEHL